jgi:hypothetical protein
MSRVYILWNESEQNTKKFTNLSGLKLKNKKRRQY